MPLYKTDVFSNDFSLEILKLLGMDDIGDGGEPVKERVARQAVFASPLPPRLKYALLALIRWLWLYGELHQIADYAEVEWGWLAKTLDDGLECVRTNLTRDQILQVAQLWPMAEDPDRPNHMEEDDLRDGIFQSGLTLPDKLVLLALVESRGVSARPRQGTYTNKELAELAGATGLSVETVEGILFSLRDEPFLLSFKAADELRFKPFLQHWILPSAPPDVADLLEFFAIRPFHRDGDLPKKRCARQAIYAATLPPLVKYALLHVVEYADGAEGADYDYECPPQLTRFLTDNQDLIKAAIPRNDILHMADQAPSDDDPTDPTLEAICLRESIHESDLPPRTRLVLLALVECQGADARPRMFFKYLPTLLSNPRDIDLRPAEVRLLEKLAAWTGLDLVEVVEVLIAISVRTSIIDINWFGPSEELFRKWYFVAGSDDGDDGDDQGWDPGDGPDGNDDGDDPNWDPDEDHSASLDELVECASGSESWVGTLEP
jgi:hypothetical protein